MSDVNLERVWNNVAGEVWRRHPGPVERIAALLLRSPGLARALLTTPSLLLPWLISTAVIFLAGGLVSVDGAEPLVWLLAPGLAAIGVAYSYGPGIDPAWELACSMPVSDRMVLLVRAVAVFAVNAILGLAISGLCYLVLSHFVAIAAAITFAWLIPMTAICTLTLAVAVATRSPNIGAAVGLSAWACVVIASWTTTGAFAAAVTNTMTYLPYLAVAVCATAVLGYVTRTQRGAL